MRTEWNKVEADVDRLHRCYMRDCQDNGDEFNIIFSTGQMFELYLKRVYEAELTADQRHRMCMMLQDLIQEVKTKQVIDWKNSKVIDFQKFRNRIQ